MLAVGLGCASKNESALEAPLVAAAASLGTFKARVENALVFEVLSDQEVVGLLQFPTSFELE